MEVAEVVVDMVVGFNNSKALTITNIDIGGGGELASSAFVDIWRLIKHILTIRQRILRWWGVWWWRATKPGWRWQMAVNAGGVIFSPTLRAFVRFEDKKS